MIRLRNRRPPDALGPLPVRLGLALFFGGLPLLAWWLDWYDLIGPAIVLALVVGGAMVGHGLAKQQAREAERREWVGKLRERE
jgi:hypothetical protein